MVARRSASRHDILTLKIFTYALLLTVMLTAVFLITVPVTNCAQGPGEQLLYEETFDDGEAQGWALDVGWKVVLEGTNGILVGIKERPFPSRWARYTRPWWCEGKFTFAFEVHHLSGSLNANVHVNGPDRYMIRLVTSEKGEREMVIHLLKQRGPVPPQYDLQARGLVYWGGRLEVQVSTEAGRILVWVGGEVRVPSLPLIDYTDRDPLPAGTVGLEMPEGVPTSVEVDYVRIIGSLRPITTTTVMTTITETTITTITKEIVPPIFYVYVTIAVVVAGGVGAAAVYSTLPGIRAPPVPDLASLNQRFVEIENLAKARPPSLLRSTADVEKILDLTKRSASKLNDIMKKLEAAKDEEGVVDTLVEFVEQIRNSSDDVGSFCEFLAQKAAEAMELKSHWFNVLTGNLVEIRHALDSATTMIHQYASGVMLFEGLARNYAFLASGAQQVENAFTLRDTNEINAAITKLRKAKSQLDIALSGVSRGLADWYGRLSWQKYLRIGVSLGK